MEAPLNRRSLIVKGISAGAVIAAGLAAEGLLPAGLAVPYRNVARPLPTYGFAGGSMVYFLDAMNLSRTMDIALAGRAGGIRFDIPWYFIQPQQNSFNWSVMDALVNAATSRGLFILGTIASTPTWAAVNTSGQPWIRPRSAADYGNFCGAVANRYKGKIDAYEIWNEPNAELFFGPTVNPAFYTSMVKAAYPKIKAADTGVTVIAGGCAQTGSQAGNLSALDFVSACYRNGLAGSCDALSFHPYDSYTSTFAEQMLYDGSAIRQSIDLHRLMQANGDGAKKLWATEIGAPTVGTITQAVQNTVVVGCLQQWQEVAFGGPMFIHTLRDQTTGSTNPEDVFGVATSAYAAKTALAGLEGLARAGFPKRNEYQVFSQNSDPSIGAAVGPVYRQSYGYALECETGSRYATNNGFISSPTVVATRARSWNLLPAGPFANGMQDMDVTGGFRVYSRTGLGTYAISGAILAAWTPDMGFPKADQYQPAGTNGAQADFEFATITWTPTGGTVVTRTST